MKPMIIDVIGTVEHLVKWALVQILLIFAMIAFALSAPLLFTVGALWLAVNCPYEAEFWGMAYLLSGPVACAVWMSILSHWPDWVADWKARKAGGYIPRSFDQRAHAFGRGLGFMFSGLFGSFLAEGIVATAARCLHVLPNHLVLFFSVAPFAVFAPCWLVVLRRWIRRYEYATA